MQMKEKKVRGHSQPEDERVQICSVYKDSETHPVCVERSKEDRTRKNEIEVEENRV